MKFRWLHTIFKRDNKKEVPKCEMFLDHEPVWDGEMFSCWKCGLEFKSRGTYLTTKEGKDD